MINIYCLKPLQPLQRSNVLRDRTLLVFQLSHQTNVTNIFTLPFANFTDRKKGRVTSYTFNTSQAKLACPINSMNLA